MGKGQSLGELCAWSEVEGRAACGGLFGARLLASTWLRTAGRPRCVSPSQSFAVAVRGLLPEGPRRSAHGAIAQPRASTAARRQMCRSSPLRSRERGEDAGGPGRCHRISPAWLPDGLAPAPRHGVRPGSRRRERGPRGAYPTATHKDEVRCCWGLCVHTCRQRGERRRPPDSTRPACGGWGSGMPVPACSSLVLSVRESPVL